MAPSAASNSSAQLLLLLLLISTYFLQPLTLYAQNTHNSVAVDSPTPPFSFSFNFTNASSYDAAKDLHFEGNVSVHGDLIDLTCDSYQQNLEFCNGRMSYSHAVPFHDDTTLASFNTSFTFAIQTGGAGPPGDGMAFFVSGYPSRMPLNSFRGGFGLFNTGAVDGAWQFVVAVEFDTYVNLPWDPSGIHIGIDNNSVHSLNTSLLPSLNLTSGNTMTATIEFNNITGMLVASLRSHDNPSMKPAVVAGVLPDLRKLLPREVAVGFSASTGASFEINQIHTWSFNSTIAPPQIPHKGSRTFGYILPKALLPKVRSAWRPEGKCACHRSIETRRSQEAGRDSEECARHVRSRAPSR